MEFKNSFTLIQEAEAASEAPAEDDFSAEANDWGSDDDEDEWGDDDDDWKRKKRSVVEQESPSERWARETHEVRFGVACCVNEQINKSLF